MKNPNLVIDIGQTFIKFVVINDNYKILYHKILNNNLLIKKDYLSYNVAKLEKIVTLNLKKILKKYRIKKIIPITHGSAAFFLNDKKECFGGPHFLQSTSRKFDQSFYKDIKKKEDFTHSIRLSNFHNLGKSFYYLLKLEKKFKIKKILTFPSLINYFLTGKTFIDKSYLGCHSFAWNFKKKKLVNFFEIKKYFFPRILKSGKKIGFLKKDFKSKIKAEVLNGIHDTSGSYLAYSKYNKLRNCIFVNTGTYFVISKKEKFRSKIQKDFYYNYGANNKLYLCKRIDAGLTYQKYNPKMINFSTQNNLNLAKKFYRNLKKKKIEKLKIITNKNQINDYMKLNFLIAFKLSSEIKKFKKNKKLIIDGIFAKNDIFNYFVKKLINFDVYIINNSFLNCIGASTFFNKKQLKLNFKNL